MMHPVAVFALGLWGVWVVLAVLAAWAVRHRRHRLTPSSRAWLDHYRPHVKLIVPFKGIDQDLPGCVRSLCMQDYPDYQLVCVVESEADPAYAALQQELQKYSDRPHRIIVAGVSPGNQGQKVHNQLAAIAALDAECDEQMVWAFADSDAVPGDDWLAQMVGPLARHNRVGMTTSYRWLIPDPTQPANLWTHLACVINSSIACFYRPHHYSLAWGGAMALRVQMARQGRLTQYLDGSLTDDYQFTRMVRDQNRRVQFLPSCMAPSPVHFTFDSLINFGRRQYLITRVYFPSFYYMALSVIGLWLLGFATAVAALAWAAATQPQGPARWVGYAAAAAMAAVFVSDQVRAHYRAQIVDTLFDQPTVKALRKTLWYERWATPLWMATHGLLVGAALIGRTMRWRGIDYHLRAPQSVRRLT